MSDPGQPTGSQRVVGDSPPAQSKPLAPTDPSAVPPTESDLDRRIREQVSRQLEVHHQRLEDQRLRIEQLEEHRRRELEEREILQLLNTLDHLFLILCPPATYGRGSSVAPSITGKQSTKSSGSNNSKCGKAVKINGTDYASRVLFTTTLLRSSEALSEDDLQNWFMMNAHILGKAEIKRCEAQAGKNGGRYDVLCGRLHTMLGDIIKEVQSKECRNIVCMVKGFELAMDAHKFTFVPDFDVKNEYAWKVHVFDKEYVVDVATVNSGNPSNRIEAETSRQRTTESSDQPDDDPTRTTTVRRIKPPKLVLYDLKLVDGTNINFEDTVSIRCLLVRALSSFYVNNELTVEFLQRLVQWSQTCLGQHLGDAAASASKSSTDLIQEWLQCLRGDERSDGCKPALVA